MHKYGIDLDDGNGADGSKTRRLDRKEVNKLMGGDNGEGVFTWREKNKKKVIRMLVAFVIAVKHHIRAQYGADYEVRGQLNQVP